MTPSQVQKLKHGLYIIHWKSGGASLAAVGSDYHGDRWMACTNWTHDDGKPIQAVGDEAWERVAKVGLICQSKY